MGFGLPLSPTVRPVWLKRVSKEFENQFLRKLVPFFDAGNGFVSFLTPFEANGQQNKTSKLTEVVANDTFATCFGDGSEKSPRTGIESFVPVICTVGCMTP